MSRWPAGGWPTRRAAPCRREPASRWATRSASPRFATMRLNGELDAAFTVEGTGRTARHARRQGRCHRRQRRRYPIGQFSGCPRHRQCGARRARRHAAGPVCQRESRSGDRPRESRWVVVGHRRCGCEPAVDDVAVARRRVGTGRAGAGSRRASRGQDVRRAQLDASLSNGLADVRQFDARQRCDDRRGLGPRRTRHVRRVEPHLQGQRRKSHRDWQAREHAGHRRRGASSKARLGQPRSSSDAGHVDADRRPLRDDRAGAQHANRLRRGGAGTGCHAGGCNGQHHGDAREGGRTEIRDLTLNARYANQTVTFSTDVNEADRRLEARGTANLQTPGIGRSAARAVRGRHAENDLGNAGRHDCANRLHARARDGARSAPVERAATDCRRPARSI